MIDKPPAETALKGANALDARLMRRLRRLATRMRLYTVLDGLAMLLLLVLICASVSFLIDYTAHGLRWSMRAAMMACFVIAAGCASRRLLWRPLRLPVGVSTAALLLERQYPSLRSVLISAVRFGAGEVADPMASSPALMRSVVSRATGEAAAIDFLAVLDHRRARRSFAILMLSAIVPAVAWLAAPATIGLWFQRNVALHDIPYPKQTRLIVELEGNECIAAWGDDLPIQAYAKGIAPRVVEFVYTTASGKTGRENMVSIGGSQGKRYRHTVKEAREDFAFYLEGGDDRTRHYEVRLVKRPRVADSDMLLTPPAYTRMPPVALGAAQRAAHVLPGTSVIIRIAPSKPITEATLMAGSDVVAQAVLDNGWYTAPFIATTSRTYHFAMIDHAGLDNRKPVRFSVRVGRDDPPRIRMSLPAIGDVITPEAILPIEITGEDTYGLATAVLRMHIDRATPVNTTIPLPGFHPGAKTITASLDVALSDANVRPGDRVELRAEASDFDDVSGPNVAQSPEVTFRVVTRETLLIELARQEKEHRRELEQLVDAQEALRGQLLTVLDSQASRPDARALATALSPLERRQRSIVGSMQTLRQQFERIVAAMRVNQCGTPKENKRLQGGIVEPLSQLLRRDLPAAADAIRRWSREATPQAAVSVDVKQAEVLTAMRDVLSLMVRWEGYQEAITLLRDIVQAQTELNNETRDKVNEQGADVFED